MNYFTQYYFFLHDSKAHEGSYKIDNDSNNSRSNLEVLNGDFDQEYDDPSMKPML